MDPRRGAEYRRLRTQFIATRPPTCHWCGATTSDTLPVGHPRKTTIDHLIEVDRARTLALDTKLWVIACHTCNSSRGSRYKTRNTRHDTGIGTPSRDW